jgi:hypothetical protein
MRDFLFERDCDAAPVPGSFSKQFRRTHDQVIFANRQRIVVAGKIDYSCALRFFDRKPIRQGNRRHERFDFVKTIRTPAFDLERKIDLRRGPKLHILQFVQQPNRRTE